MANKLAMTYGRWGKHIIGKINMFTHMSLVLLFFPACNLTYLRGNSLTSILTQTLIWSGKFHSNPFDMKSAIGSAILFDIRSACIDTCYHICYDICMAHATQSCVPLRPSPGLGRNNNRGRFGQYVLKVDTSPLGSIWQISQRFLQWQNWHSATTRLFPQHVFHVEHIWVMYVAYDTQLYTMQLA